MTLSRCFSWIAARFEPRCFIACGPRTPEGYVDPEAIRKGDAWVCLKRSRGFVTSNVNRGEQWATACIPICKEHWDPWIHESEQKKPNRAVRTFARALEHISIAAAVTDADSRRWSLELHPLSWFFWGTYPERDGAFYVGPVWIFWPTAKKGT